MASGSQLASPDTGALPVSRCSAPVDGAQRQRRVFAGEVLLFGPALPGFRQLIERARALMCAHLGEVPSLAHRRLPRERFLAAVLELQAAFSSDALVHEAWQAALAQLGVATPVFSDQRFLRVLPPRDAPNAGRVAPLHAHRDTWGSRVMQQENWWAPLLPVSDRSTLALYPGYWHRPMASDVESWSFEEYRRRRAAAGAAGNIGYASAPQPERPPPYAEAMPLRMVPGELAVFSGAHLHGSIPNRSGLTRFSFETRTVVLDEAGHLPGGAPNVDGRTDAPRWEWFRDREGRTLASVLARG